MSNRVSLARAVRNDFSPQIRKRGERYFRDRRVFETTKTEESVAAKVRGENDVYEVEISWKNGSGLGTRCSCPYFTGHEGDPCKHLWAVILTFDRRGWPKIFTPASPPRDASKAASSSRCQGQIT